MIVLYLGAGIIVLIDNAGALPNAFKLIFQLAFTPAAAPVDLLAQPLNRLFSLAPGVAFSPMKLAWEVLLLPMLRLRPPVRFTRA